MLSLAYDGPLAGWSNGPVLGHDLTNYGLTLTTRGNVTGAYSYGGRATGMQYNVLGEVIRTFVGGTTLDTTYTSANNWVVPVAMTPNSNGAMQTTLGRNGWYAPGERGQPGLSQPGGKFSENFGGFPPLFSWMPRNARVVASGLPYHVTQRGTNRERVFFSVEDRYLYLRLIRENLEPAGVRVLAYCLMTNHVHFVVVPERDDSLALLFGRANGRYAQSVNIRKGRCGHLWQARYHSCPMSEGHLWMGLRYVEANPCRAKMVERPEEYRWSSAAAHLLGQPDRSRILDQEFWHRSGGAATWAEMHRSPASEEATRELRKCTYAGRPFGEESFVSAMEERFHRQWRRPGQAPKNSARMAVSA